VDLVKGENAQRRRVDFHNVREYAEGRARVWNFELLQSWTNINLDRFYMFMRKRNEWMIESLTIVSSFRRLHRRRSSQIKHLWWKVFNLNIYEVLAGFEPIIIRMIGLQVT